MFDSVVFTNLQRCWQLYEQAAGIHPTLLTKVLAWAAASGGAFPMMFVNADDGETTRPAPAHALLKADAENSEIHQRIRCQP